jgi:hypothetical protein
LIKSLLISKDKLLEATCFIWGITANNEIELLRMLIKYSENGQILLSATSRTSIEKEINLSSSSFSQSLSRLKSKGVLAQVDKTITLNPCFKDFNEVTGILLKI